MGGEDEAVSAAEHETWRQRTITLIGDAATVERHCDDWREAGWLVTGVADAGPTHAGHPSWTVTVRVPPLDWVGHLQAADLALA